MRSRDYNTFLSEHFVAFVKSLLHHASDHGFEGERHLYIVFDTRVVDVHIPQSLRDVYPELMSIILQHRYKKLYVGAEHFSVQLSFNGTFEDISIPYHSVHAIADHSVQFLLQFPENVAQNLFLKDEAHFNNENVTNTNVEYLSKDTMKNSHHAQTLQSSEDEDEDNSAVLKQKQDISYKNNKVSKKTDTDDVEEDNSDKERNSDDNVIDISRFHKP